VPYSTPCSPGACVQDNGCGFCVAVFDGGAFIKNSAVGAGHFYVNVRASFGYARYYAAYEAIGLINELPDPAAIAVKAAYPQWYAALLAIQAEGLAQNTMWEAAETHVIRAPEQVFDEGGFPTPSRVLPGIHKDLTVDFNY
jgi:hypothetical protein